MWLIEHVREYEYAVVDCLFPVRWFRFPRFEFLDRIEARRDLTKVVKVDVRISQGVECLPDGVRYSSAVLAVPEHGLPWRVARYERTVGESTSEDVCRNGIELRGLREALATQEWLGRFGIAASVNGESWPSNTAERRAYDLEQVLEKTRAASCVAYRGVRTGKSGVGCFSSS